MGQVSDNTHFPPPKDEMSRSPVVAISINDKMIVVTEATAVLDSAVNDSFQYGFCQSSMGGAALPAQTLWVA